MADGTTLANGTVTVAWQNFTGADGHFSPAGSKIYTVTNGAFSQLLQPSSNSSPHFSYKITYKFGSQSPAQCSWVVPPANSNIPDIETCPSPASSVPATNISLSQISAGGGSDGMCVIVNGGVLSTSACTNFWSKVGNDIFNSNSGNVGIGTAPGSYKLDISRSGTLGTFRLWDQTSISGITYAEIRAGAGQTSGHDLLDFKNNAGTVTSAFVSTGLLQTIFSGLGKIQVGSGIAHSNDALDCWANNADINAGSYDLGLRRNAAGILEVNNCSPGTFRDMKFRNLTLTGLAGTAVQCLQADSNGNIIGTGSACGSGGGGGGGNAWTVNGNDIFNSNSGNVGIGATPGTYKLDVSRSGSSGTARFYDQTAVTGATKLVLQKGASQASNTSCIDNLLTFLDNTGTPLALFDCVGDYAILDWADSSKKKVGIASNLFGVGTSSGIGFASNAIVTWKSVDNLDAAGSYDVGLGRNATGVVEINSGTPGTYRDLKLRNETLVGLSGLGTRCVHVDTNGVLGIISGGDCQAQGLTGSASISFGAIQDGTCSTQNLTVTGATTGGKVAAGWPSSLETDLYGTMIVTASNTVQIRLCNAHGSAVTPATQTFAATVF